jgi:hypothetical protein
MKLNSVLTTVILLLIVANRCHSQIPNTEWNRSYSYGYYMFCKKTLELDGGGFIIAGSLGEHGNRQVILFETDADGFTIWHNIYDLPYSCYSSGLCSTPEGGYLISGYAYNNSDQSAGFALKTDRFGEEIWFRSYEFHDLSYFSSVAITENGDYLFSGIKSDSGVYDKLFVLFNGDGEVIQAKSYRAPTALSIRSLVESNKGDFVAAGSIHTLDSDESDVYVIKVNSVGDSLWAGIFGYQYLQEWCYDVVENPDNSIMVCGMLYERNNGPTTLFLYKITPNGNFEWGAFYEINNSSPFYPVRLLRTVNNEFALSSTTHDSEVILIKADSQGDSLWSFVYHHPNWRQVQCHSLIQTADGGYHLAGFREMGWAMKLSGETTGIDDDEIDLPLKSTLLQNHPNPFNASTTIEFQLAKESRIKLIVYDLLGNEVVTLVDGELPAGEHSVNWDAAGLSSGVYFYRVTSGDRVETRRMTLLK